MTHRERFLRTMHFEPVDHVPDQEFGYWAETLPLWHEQGLPKEIDDDAKADIFFGFAPQTGVPVNQWLLPGFESKVIEESGDYVIVQDGEGATYKSLKSGSSSIPHYLDFGLKGREEWERDYKPRLNPEDPRRLPDPTTWEQTKQYLINSDLPVGIGIGSLYGQFRNLMGFERAAMMVYDDPVLLEEMMEQETQVVLRTIGWAAPQVKIDFGGGWEDMCYKSGPMISPAIFEKLMAPRYKRITDLLKKYGCDVVWTDCDGNIVQLIPLWLEAGVNCMFPVEVAAGSDPIALRDKYGKDILFCGGVNKRALAAGKEAIKAELNRIAPVVKQGGWIPHVDHRVPPDVSFENYKYYLTMKRDLFGISEPAPWEERRPTEWGPISS